MFLFTYCILLRNVTSLQVLILCMFYSKLYMVQVQLHDTIMEYGSTPYYVGLTWKNMAAIH